MRPTTFGVAAFCAACLFVSSAALCQNANHHPNTTGSALREDIIGGSIYTPDGITHIVGDGMGGGFVFGPLGMSMFISNGMGGGTLYAPNSTGAIIGDGMGGGTLYSSNRTQSSPEQGPPSSPTTPPLGSEELTRD